MPNIKTEFVPGSNTPPLKPPQAPGVRPVEPLITATSSKNGGWVPPALGAVAAPNTDLMQRLAAALASIKAPGA